MEGDRLDHRQRGERPAGQGEVEGDRPTVGMADQMDRPFEFADDRGDRRRLVGQRQRAGSRPGSLAPCPCRSTATMVKRSASSERGRTTARPRRPCCAAARGPGRGRCLVGDPGAFAHGGASQHPISSVAAGEAAVVRGLEE
jgi:hypothetical protein